MTNYHAMIIVVEADTEEGAYNWHRYGDLAKVQFVGEPWPVKPTVDGDDFETVGVIQQRPVAGTTAGRIS